MRMQSRAVRLRDGGRVVLSVAGCLVSAVTAAQPAPLTLPDVIARARSAAPAVVIAALTLEETRGRLVGAERRFSANPDLDGAIGRRNGEDGELTDLQVGISQMFQPGSRRRARIDGARAALDETRADIEDARRRSIGAAVEAFYRAVYAGDRLRLLRSNTTLAAEVLAVTERRYAAGDVAGLDVNLARSSLARTRAEVAGAEADAVIARGELQRLLGLPSPIAVDGSLAGAVADAVTLDSRLTALAARPDLQALEAGVREARAEANVGRSFARPEYGVGARFSREEGDRIVMGTFTISLPLAVKGQDTIVTGLGREARLAATLDATRLQARIEVTATHAAYEQRHAALRLLEQDVVASLDDTLRLATRSFDVGQIGIADLLVMRREVNEARLQYLDTLLATVLARVALDSASGVLR
jgi:cobalt-zinc-cadmium efflux system outer membrane protein